MKIHVLAYTSFFVCLLAAGAFLSSCAFADDGLATISGEWATSPNRCGVAPDRDDNVPLVIDANGIEFTFNEAFCKAKSVRKLGKSDFSVKSSCEFEGEPYELIYQFQKKGDRLFFGEDKLGTTYYRCKKTEKKVAFGNYPLASCAGWGGTIVSISNLNTEKATMTGRVTRADIGEYCERDPGGETLSYGGKMTLDECVEQHVHEVKNVKLVSIANCRRSTISSNYGSRSTKVHFPVSDGSCASGNLPLMEQFKLLCPKRASEIRLGPS